MKLSSGSPTAVLRAMLQGMTKLFAGSILLARLFRLRTEKVL
ncbi:hypothetical protein DCCM_4274 [Desulfocucumis palustris]|uniref:Uncharacterized protein n=1 Tax=Desulfocucumis palustris TaxID=1898651 RepID=A0A2L2XMH4_9FIRM|nr:hypothetical protein DCCM_4274 [Desulfocucumis palustris]